MIGDVSSATAGITHGTTVTGIHTAITLYTLVMASLMITGGKIGEILAARIRDAAPSGPSLPALPTSPGEGTSSLRRPRAPIASSSRLRQLGALDQQQHRFSYAAH